MSEDHGQRLQALEQNLQKMHEEQTAQMNRLLAQETLIRGLLRRLPSEVLRSLASEYEEQWMAAMALVPPAQQRPHLWQQHVQQMAKYEEEAFAAEQDALRRSVPTNQEKSG